MLAIKTAAQTPRDERHGQHNHSSCPGQCEEDVEGLQSHGVVSQGKSRLLKASFKLPLSGRSVVSDHY